MQPRLRSSIKAGVGAAETAEEDEEGDGEAMLRISDEEDPCVLSCQIGLETRGCTRASKDDDNDKRCSLRHWAPFLLKKTKLRASSMAQERTRLPADVVWGVLDDALVHVTRILAAVSCCMLFVIVIVNINPQFVDAKGVTLPYTPLPDTEEQTTVARASNATGNALILIAMIYLVIESAFMALMLITFLPPYTVWVVLAVIPIWDLVAVLAVHGPLRILVETAKERKEGLQPGLVFATVVVGTFPGMASRPRGSSAAGRPSGNRRKSSASGPSGRRPSDASPEGRAAPRRKTSDVEAFDPAVSRRKPSYDTSIAPDPEESEAPERAAKAIAEDRLPISPTRARKQPFKDNDPDSDSSSEDEERQGIKMGLGDFVFYSVLVGKVATFGDWTLVCACFVGILVGICVTLFALAITQSALPALPVSLAFGLVFAGLHQSVQNFMNDVSFHRALL
ncbi:hypothetical protein HPB48_010507 [Haemaphysalis longicornis]|uniref:Presenilin n=1 Tax=Haemaphysalis longicornis TaxID=44386 RepID=A0A9J6FNU9_HAELO|nr:hypothetical protein HPB48_010507 [Haemaphysalis longicornis]